jgi:hypothetical protein
MAPTFNSTVYKHHHLFIPVTYIMGGDSHGHEDKHHEAPKYRGEVMTYGLIGGVVTAAAGIALVRPTIGSSLFYKTAAILFVGGTAGSAALRGFSIVQRETVKVPGPYGNQH